MATAVNAKVKYTPSGALPKVQLKAAASQTWKQGEFGYLSSGQVATAVTGAVPYCIFAEEQASQTSANDLVWCYLLEVGTELELCVTNNGTDAAETTAVIGAQHDLYVASNKHYLDVNASTDDCFLVLKHGSSYDAATRTATETPGRVLARVLKVV